MAELALSDACACLGSDVSRIVALYCLSSAWGLASPGKVASWPWDAVAWMSRGSPGRHVDPVWKALLRDDPSSAVATNWTFAPGDKREEAQRTAWVAALQTAVRLRAWHVARWLTGERKSRKMACACLFEGDLVVAGWLARTKRIGPADVSLVGKRQPLSARALCGLARQFNHAHWTAFEYDAVRMEEPLASLQEVLGLLQVDLTAPEIRAHQPSDFEREALIEVRQWLARRSAEKSTRARFFQTLQFERRYSHR